MKEVLRYLRYCKENLPGYGDKDFEAAVPEKAEELYKDRLGRFETV